MKSYLLLLLLTITVACSKTEEPAPAASASFTASRSVVEVNEPVILTNTSTNATRYEWVTSDAPTQKNTTISPVASFAAPGTYTITLTAYNSENKAVTTQQAIKVGLRYLKEARATGINFFNSTGQPWDSDNSGPDVYFRIQKAGANVVSGQPTSNVAAAQLPLVWNAVPANIEMVPDNNWSLAFFDHNTVLADEYMIGWQFAVNTPPANRDALGNSSNTFTSPDGRWNVELKYETR